MFWTNWVRGINKIFLVVGIIASLLGGFSLMESSPQLGIIVICVGILLSITLVSVIMMISEISVSLYEINNKTSINKGNVTSSNKEELPSNHNNQETWVCPECNTVNQDSYRYCKDCGYQK